MKTLITIAALSLSLSGFALANDRAGDFSWVEPSSGQSYDEKNLSGRAGYPTPMPSMSDDDGIADLETDSNGRA